MRLLLFLIILLPTIFFSNNYKETIYKTKDGFYELSLKSDSSFFVSYLCGFHLKYIRGYWKKNYNNEIILTSKYENLKDIPISVEEIKINDNDSITFNIISEIPADSSIKTELILDTTSYLYNKLLRTSSKINFSDVRVRTYFNSEYSIREPLQNELISEIYKVKSTETNYFKINWDVKGEMFYYETIQNDTLKIKGKKLFWDDKKLIFYRQ